MLVTKHIPIAMVGNQLSKGNRAKIQLLQWLHMLDIRAIKMVFMKKFSLVVSLVLLIASNAFANCTTIYVNGVPNQVCGDNVNPMRSSNPIAEMAPYAKFPDIAGSYSEGRKAREESELRKLQMENIKLQNELARKQLESQ